MASLSSVYYWTGAAWSSAETTIIKNSLVDSLHKPKFAEIWIADPDHTKQNSGNYSPYKRIKIVDFFTDKVSFFGRIEFVDPKNDNTYGPVLVLQCRDFLQELCEETADSDFSGFTKLGDLIKCIVDYYVFTKINYSGAGGFTSQEHVNSGNWISTGTGGRARLIYVDTGTKTLVITDVRNAQYFINGATLTEYTDAGCSAPSGISDTQSGALVHNIDTSQITSIGDIDINTTKNCFRESSTPLELIRRLCLMGSSTGVYDFFLEEGSGASLYPPVFRLFLRGSRPTGGLPTNGLTIKYEGTNSDQERIMYTDYKFPEPSREIYTEAKATSTNTSGNLITSVKKAGSVAFQLEVLKKRVYQALEHYTQTGLDSCVDRFIAMTGTNIIRRGDVSITYYPSYYISPNYYLVRAGDLVRVVNDRVTFTASPGVDMIVVEVKYEEPPVTSSLQLTKQYGIGIPEYEYPDDQIVTKLPVSVDPRTIDEMETPDWSTILPQAVQGYHHNISFDAVDQDTISIVAGTVKFYDGTSLSIDYIGSDGETTYDLSTTDIVYIYFDLDVVDSNILRVTTNYLTAMDEKTGLVCLAQKGSATGIKATIIPSYGKEPLLTPDVIDMTGIKTYDYGGGTYLQALLNTQIQSGHILISAQTNFDNGYNPYEKAKVFFQPGIPLSVSPGDLWIDSDNENKMYRAAIAGADEIKAGEWEDVRDTDIAQAIADAATAQATADGKVTTFYQATTPTAEAEGDLWVNTGNGNKLYRWDTASWVEVQDDAIAQALADAATAQATADSKIITFFQAGIPTSTDVGDLWVDTDDNNKLYRAAMVGANEIKAGEWEEATSAGAPEVYTGPTPPADTSLLWIDTSVEPNVLRRYATGEGPFYEQQERNTTTYVNLYTGSTVGFAQRKTILERTITKIGFWAWKVGTTTGNVTYTIRTIGNPGTVVASKSFDVGLLSLTAYTYYEDTFASPVTTSGDIRFCIEYSGGSSSTNCVRVAYANADYKTTEYKSTMTGTTWTDQTSEDASYKMTYTGGWVTVDPVEIDYSGVVLDATKGINIYGRNMAFTTSATKWGTPQCYIGSDGKFYAGGGAVYLDSTGLKLYAGASQRGQLLSDGSGWFGSGSTTGIRWNTSGDVTMNSCTMNSCIVTGLLAGSVISATYITVGDLSATRIYGGILNCTNITVTNLSASSINTGTLSGAYISGGTISGTIFSQASGSVYIDSTGIAITGTLATSGKLQFKTSSATVGFMTCWNSVITPALYGTIVGSYSGYCIYMGPGDNQVLPWGAAVNLGNTAHRWKYFYLQGSLQYVTVAATTSQQLSTRASGQFGEPWGRYSDTSGQYWDYTDFGPRVDSSGNFHVYNKMSSSRLIAWLRNS